MMNISFIGCGNMASAIIKGLVSNGYDASGITAADRIKANLDNMAESTGINITESNVDAVTAADIVIAAVKPQQLEGVLEEIREYLEGRILVTLAPGKTLKWIGEHLKKGVKIVRTMPSTPALVGEGMTAVCANKYVTEEELYSIVDIFKSVGKAVVIPEYLFDVSVGVGSSSPAFVFMFIEAMADAAVYEGMSRQQAYAFAAQAVYGSAKLVLETGIHPGELKDRVCSPAGTTIEGLRTLEQNGFRGTVMDAVIRTIEKSRNL